MSKSVIVIGGGIAGLTAGIYCRLSGIDVTILEQHSIPGGMCTGWKRKGYTFDGAMHWLTGSADGTTLNKLWREVGAIDDSVKVRYDDPFRSAEYNGGIIYIFRDAEKTRKHFDEISPEDKEATKQFVSDIKALRNMQMPITDIKGVRAENPTRMKLGTMMKMAKVMPIMNRLSNMSAQEYINRFKSPAIRLLLESVVPGGDYSAIGIMVTLATLCAGDGGYPEGGSIALPKRMADKFLSLGGKLLCNTRVQRISVKDGKTTGVIVNEKLMPADVVIVTQDTIAASEQLFEKPLTDAWIVKLKEQVKHAACCFISVGVKEVLKETPLFSLPKPIKCGGFEYNALGFNNYSDYKGYAPEGSTALTIFLGGDSYDFWKKAKDEGRYEAEKQLVADQIVEAMVTKYPQLEGKFEVIDVATPVTYERYTGSSHGSWMEIMEKGRSAMQSCPCTVSDTKGVYFAGHRTLCPGGMPAALATGRNAAQMACRQFDIVFKNN